MISDSSMLHREVFQCSVLISLWRMSHAWRKSLNEKCSDYEMHGVLSRRLGEAVSCMGKGTCDVDFFESFLETFVDCSDFLDYFKAVWIPKLGWSHHPLLEFVISSSQKRFVISYLSHELGSFHILVLNCRCMDDCLKVPSCV